MSGLYIPIQIGCIECDEQTIVLGITTDLDRAKEILAAHEKTGPSLAGGSLHIFKLATDGTFAPLDVEEKSAPFERWQRYDERYDRIVEAWEKEDDEDG